MPYEKIHAPVYGYMKGYKHTIPLHLVHYARTFSIFKLLNKISLGKVLNVGGADGYHSYLIQKLFNVRTVTLDVNEKSLEFAASKFGLSVKRGSALDIPFDDDSFDSVLCIETIEHIEDPIQVVNELKRVAKKNVIISTESFFDSHAQISQFLMYIRETHPQFFRCVNPASASDVSYFTRDDFHVLFDSKDLSFYPQFSSKQAETIDSIEGVRNKVKKMTEGIEVNRQTKVIVHFQKKASSETEKLLTEETLLRGIISDSPLFELEYDKEMRAEDEANIQRLKEWHKEKSFCRIVDSESSIRLPIEEEGAKNMTLQWILPDDLERSPSFCTRKVTLGANGKTPNRKTSWEHQLYILSGKGELLEKGRKTRLKPGMGIQIRPYLSFEVINTSIEELVFLDIVPSITSFFGR